MAVGREVQAIVDYPLPPGWKAEFLPSRPGLLGVADGGTKTVTVYVRDGRPTRLVAADYAHEVGHAVDFTYGTDDRRAQWMDIRGYGQQTWFGCNMCTDYQTPAGDFAEVFAYWRVGSVWRSQMAGPPDQAQLQRLVPLMHP